MSKIRRGFIEDYFYCINREIILFDKFLSSKDCPRQYLNPIDGTKAITFNTKGFKDGDMYYITNISDNPDNWLYQANTDITIYPGQMYQFYYTGEKSIVGGLKVVGALQWYAQYINTQIL